MDDERIARIVKALKEQGRDDLAATVEYDHARVDEVRHELDDLQAVVGERITSEVAARELQNILMVLRAAGNTALAMKYQTAFKEWMDAINKQEQLVRAAFDGDSVADATLIAARDESEDAQEAFERIEAEALAWFEAH